MAKAKQPATVADHLRVATKQVAAGKFDLALAAALEAWRATRSVSIARGIDRISKLVTRRPLGSGSLKAMNTRWHEVAEKLDALDLPRLLAALANGWVQSVPKRLEVIAGFPADPRTPIGLVTFLGTAPYQSAARAVEANAAARELVLLHADERVLEALAPYAGRKDIDALSVEVEAAIKPPRDFTEDEARAIAAFETALAGLRSGDDLLAAIFAAPGDDGARAVYADWLLEQGNPHGELINLQLRAVHEPLPPDAQAREKELLAKLENKLCAPFAKVTTSDRTIARGFVSRVTIDPKNSRTMATALAAPEWGLVEAITIASSSFVGANTFIAPVFAQLQALRRASSEIARFVVFGPPRPRLAMLTVDSWLPEQLGDQLLNDPRPWVGVPALKGFGIRATSTGPAVLDPLWRHPIASQLQIFELEGISESEIPDWLRAFVPTQIVDVRVQLWPHGKRYRRVPGAADWTPEP